MVASVTRVSDATEIKLLPGGVQGVECLLSVPDHATFFECFADTDAPAIRGTSDEAPLTHGALKAFLSGAGSLRARGIEVHDVVGIVMPNGPELAVALITCACQCIAAPLSSSMTEAELSSAFGQLNIKHAIALPQRGAPGQMLEQVCTQAVCELHCIWPVRSGTAGVFAWAGPPRMSKTPSEGPVWTAAGDVALLLRTSGTTSKPKVVPLTPKGLYTGAVCIGSGLKLAAEDVCLNVMPYTHIGGISCSLLASLFAGSSVICASGFDAAEFVRWLDCLRPTWYYAVPTIHKAVALFVRGLPSGALRHGLRLIRSGAAHLPEADAQELRDIFQCCVLPTYSMSECMPVAQPPLDYCPQEKQGSVGVPLASSMRVVACSADSGVAALPFGDCGEVCIQGPVVTHGYLDDEQANNAAFFGKVDIQDGRWFRTGDVGYLDRDGYLFLTGRSKELIKRGGEQVSPYEVEEALLSHPAVEVAVVFGVPNEFWGEEVAAAVVLKSSHTLSAAGSSADAMRELQRFAGTVVLDAKVPRQVVLLKSAEELPKTQTGKYARTGMAKHFGLRSVDLAAATHLRQTAAPRPGNSRVPVRPHKATYGLRYFLAMWVVFIHAGPDKPLWLAAWKQYSASMPGFFILAGFLLASSNPKPVESKLQFYRNRLIAAHPLYLLAVLYSLPITFLVCPPGRAGIAEEDLAPMYCGLLNRGISDDTPYLPGSYSLQVTYMIIMVLFGQLAWPWGMPAFELMGFSNGALWFSSSYYFCIICFPFLHAWLHSRCLMGSRPSQHLERPRPSRFCCWPVLSLYIIITCCAFLLWLVIPLPFTWLQSQFRNPGLQEAVSALSFMVAYCCPPTWAFIFFLGMLTAKLFELNRQGTESPVWRHWGKLTDCTSLLMGFSLVTASLLWCLDPEVDSASYDGPTPGGATSLVGKLWARPGRLLMGPVCVWIYGLATGQGLTARLMSSRALVTYLSPAAYSVYLFHLPTFGYWKLIKVKLFGWSPWDEVKWWNGVVDYFVTLISATLVAMLAAHKLNAPLTTVFMRWFDRLCGCACREEAPEDENTFEQVARAIKGLSGVEVRTETPITECGLDSFGTSALLGVIRPVFRGLRLTPLEMYGLANVGELAARIDADVAAAAAPGGDCAASGMRTPLARNADCGA